eukprot:GHVU01010038.1.p1 GENE.GHVU01010038.1~~GHVU01010038.1.p1  ORF type:complete len:482 (-),score=91.68 GHVU01010038.1:542-1987(-)
MSSAAVSAIKWVPRGKARRHPERCEITAEDFEEIRNNVNESSRQRAEDPGVPVSAPDRARRGSSGSSGSASGEEESDKEDDPMGDNFPGCHFFSTFAGDMDKIVKDPNLKHYADSEDEALEILPDDCVLIAANAEVDASTLEVYVYDEEEASFYVHHEITVGTFPLCLEWVSRVQGRAGDSNVVAMGSFDSAIELWDLDTTETLEAVMTLGTPQQPQQQSNPTGKKKKKSTAASSSVPQPDEGHQEAVMCLNAHPAERHLLASGSADNTVKVWDLHTGECAHTLRHHKGKVQCCRWHPSQPSLLLTAAYDKSVRLVDTRTGATATSGGGKVKLSSDPECACWDRHAEWRGLVSTEEGEVVAIDTRKFSTESTAAAKGGQKALEYAFQAHKTQCTGISDSAVPGLLVTSCLNGKASVWKATDAGAPPQLVRSRNLKGGPLFCLGANPDVEWLFAFGGGTPVIWDLRDSEEVVSAFPAAAASL